MDEILLKNKEKGSSTLELSDGKSHGNNLDTFT